VLLSGTNPVLPAGIADPYSTPFDFCTDATYDAERSSDPPLTPKELATLPPVPAGPAYKADPQTGRRVYRFTTQANCTCSPRSWDHYDPVRAAMITLDDLELLSKLGACCHDFAAGVVVFSPSGMEVVGSEFFWPVGALVPGGSREW
jgi:hypothetical protein